MTMSAICRRLVWGSFGLVRRCRQECVACPRWHVDLLRLLLGAHIALKHAVSIAVVHCDVVA